MHEMAITKSILNIAISEADKHGASRVLSIKLKIGDFSDAIPQFIQEYYNLASRGTIAENARLVIDRIPAVVRCKDCGCEGAIDKHKIRCPKCGSGNINLVSGTEFLIESLEVE